MKSITHYLFFIFLFFLPLSLFSRSHTQLDEGADVLPFLRGQWDNSFMYAFADKTHSVTMPTSLVRLGITSFAELRFQYEGVLEFDKVNKPNYLLSPLLFGAKFRIYDGWKGIPQIAFLANLTVPLYNQFDTGEYWTPSLYWLFQNDVTKWFRIGYCLGAEWSGKSLIPSTLLSVFLEFNITQKFIAFAESYNYFTTVSKGKTIADCHMDIGLNYEFNEVFEIYAFSSWNLQAIDSYVDVGLGLVWNFNRWSN